MSTLLFFDRLQIFVSNRILLSHHFLREAHFLLSVTGSELQGTVEEVENLRKEVDKLKHSGEKDFCVSSSGSDISTSTLLTH